MQPGEHCPKEHFQCLECGCEWLAAKYEHKPTWRDWSQLRCPACLDRWPAEEDARKRSLYYEWLSFKWWEEGYSTDGGIGWNCPGCSVRTHILANGKCLACHGREKKECD
jgi:hypothetical protein